MAKWKEVPVDLIRILRRVNQGSAEDILSSKLFDLEEWLLLCGIKASSVGRPVRTGDSTRTSGASRQFPSQYCVT